MMEDIAIFGAGGFGRELACLIREINKKNHQWNLIGFFDDAKPKGSSISYSKILGNMDDLNAFPSKLNLAIAIGNPHGMCQVVQRITNINIEFPNIIAPDMQFLEKETTTFGKGNVFCLGCVVTCNVHIGDFNVFNGYISVGHDVTIGSFNSLMPGTRVSGNVSIGSKNFFGVSSVVLPKNHIGNNTVIGAGSVIMRNTKDNSTYVGNPAVMVKF